jgi:membrane protein implicated in regulation of membrane protease activity
MPIRKQRRTEGPRDFDFFRYEVWFGMAIGALIATVLALYAWPVMLLASTLGVSWGLTHLLGRWFTRNRSDKKRSKEEEDERERRALANRQAASIENEQAARRRHRRRR